MCVRKTATVKNKEQDKKAGHIYTQSRSIAALLHNILRQYTAFQHTRGRGLLDTCLQMQNKTQCNMRESPLTAAPECPNCFIKKPVSILGVKYFHSPCNVKDLIEMCQPEEI